VAAVLPDFRFPPDFLPCITDAIMVPLLAVILMTRSPWSEARVARID
jgi:hypothetical protein